MKSWSDFGTGILFTKAGKGLEPEGLQAQRIQVAVDGDLVVTKQALMEVGAPNEVEILIRDYGVAQLRLGISVEVGRFREVLEPVMMRMRGELVKVNGVVVGVQFVVK